MTAIPIHGPPWGMGDGQGSPIVPPPSPRPGSNQIPPPPLGRAIEYPIPDVFPLPDSTQFNTLGQQTSSVIEGPVTLLGATANVPANTKFRISSLNVDIDNMLLSTNVTWTLLVNDQAVAGFTGITLFPRLAPFVGGEFDVFYRGFGPAIIKLVYFNNDGGSYVIGGALSGWFWMLASEQRWKSGGV